MHFRVFNLDLISMHTWRQTETQTVIQNFAREDMNIFNPRINNRGDFDGIYRKEFPIMQWIIAVSYKIFGESIILSRIMMYIFSVITMLGFYKIGDFYFGRNSDRLNINNSESGIARLLPLVPAFFILFSPTFFFFSVNPIPDVFALMCASWGLYLFFKWYSDRKKKSLIICLILLMVSSLAKLPFILFYSLFLLPVLTDLKNGSFRALFKYLFLLLISIIPIFSWYYYAIQGWNGNGILSGIFAVKGSGAWQEYFHYFKFNLISTLPELLVGYAILPIFLTGLFFSFYSRIYKSQKFKILFTPFLLYVLYFIFELNMIGEAHDYYLFPFYPFIGLLTAYGFKQIINRSRKLAIIAVSLLLILPFTTYIRLKGRWNIEKPGFNKDLLIYKSKLRNAVPDSSLCIAGNDISEFIMLYYIDKKGWVFSDNNLNPSKLAEMIRSGARYLYTDNHDLLIRQEISPFIDKEIAVYGSIEVYKLREVDK